MGLTLLVMLALESVFDIPGPLTAHARRGPVVEFSRKVAAIIVEAQSIGNEWSDWLAWINSGKHEPPNRREVLAKLDHFWRRYDSLSKRLAETNPPKAARPVRERYFQAFQTAMRVMEEWTAYFRVLDETRGREAERLLYEAESLMRQANEEFTALLKAYRIDPNEIGLSPVITRRRPRWGAALSRSLAV